MLAEGVPSRHREPSTLRAAPPATSAIVQSPTTGSNAAGGPPTASPSNFTLSVEAAASGERAPASNMAARGRLDGSVAPALALDAARVRDRGGDADSLTGDDFGRSHPISATRTKKERDFIHASCDDLRAIPS